jgi:hypothetical protein
VFYALENFSADEHTEAFLFALAANPVALAGDWVIDLTDHLAELLPHSRQSVSKVAKAIVDTYREHPSSFRQGLYSAGAGLVDIAMTLQRFSDTRDQGLDLLESLLKLNLDAAFASLPDREFRPVSASQPERWRRRRRRLPE